MVQQPRGKSEDERIISRNSDKNSIKELGRIYLELTRPSAFPPLVIFVLLACLMPYLVPLVPIGMKASHYGYSQKTIKRFWIASIVTLVWLFSGWLFMKLGINFVTES